MRRQIRKLFEDSELHAVLKGEGKEAWEAFKMVVTYLLGNKKTENYPDFLKNLLKAYEKFGCKISLKIHFLLDHLEYLPENCRNI